MGDETEKVEKIARKVAEEMIPEKQLEKTSPMTNILLAIASTLGAAAVIGLIVMYGRVTSMSQTLENADKWATKEQTTELKEDLTKQIDKNASDIEKLEDRHDP